MSDYQGGRGRGPPPRGGPPGGGGGGAGPYGGPPGGGAGRGGGGGRGPPGGGGRGGGGGGGGRGFGMLTPQQALREVSQALQALSVASAAPATPKWSKQLLDAQPDPNDRRARRPGFGTLGLPYPVSANHFLLKMTATQAFHYDVRIEALRDAGAPAATAAPRRGGGRGRSGGGTEGSGGASRAQRPLPRGLCRALLLRAAAEAKWPAGWAYDGAANMWAATAFLGTSQDAERSVTVKLSDEGTAGKEPRERAFRITLKWVATVDLGEVNTFISGQGSVEPPATALQVLEVVLRHGVAMRDYTRVVGSSSIFMFPRENPLARDMSMPLGRGLVAWAGYKQSVRPCQFGLALSIDLAAQALLEEQDLPQLAAALMGARAVDELQRLMGDPRRRKRIERDLRGIRVAVARGGKTFRKTVTGLGAQGVGQTMFFNEALGRQQSVAEYNQQQYGVRVRYPWLPPVNLSTDRNHPVWQPMEVCRVVPGQRKRMLDDASVTSKMLQFAGLKPRDRKPYLTDVVANPELGGFNKDPTIRAFGIEVSQQMAAVRARVLPAPRLMYGNRACLDPGDKGAWNLRSVSFPSPAAVQSWALVVLAPRSEMDVQGPTSLRAFVTDLLSAFKERSMACSGFPAGPLYVEDLGASASTAAALTAGAQAALTATGKPCQLLLVLVPEPNADRYRDVKQASDSVLGCPSQVFTAVKAGVGRSARPPRGRMQYCANLALKINAKLDGVNVQIVDPEAAGVAKPGTWPAMQSVPFIGKRPFMLLGADVTHPVGFDSSEPSVAAVTGSLDHTLGRFAAKVIRQGRRQEIITTLKDAVKELMKAFYQTTRLKPEALVYYRDGVAEGQFRDVLSAEYQAIRMACSELQADYCPPITFVVVQKRHVTRLFPEQGATVVEDNTMPGVVIDRDICSPTQFDFYLNSHAGLQGHNKAAHYHVLVDENGFSADALQLLTYWLCFLYCRCPRSVSYSTPAYYAHLAAFRGRLMLQEGSDEGVSQASSGGANVAPMLSIHAGLASRMYYC